MSQWPRRRRIAVVLVVLVTLLASAELAFLVLVSRPFFRAWFASELARAGTGAFEFGSVGGFPWSVAVRDVTFVASGPGNMRRVRAPVAFATLEWTPLVTERRLAVRTLALQDASIEARLDGTEAGPMALPLPAQRVCLRHCSVRLADVGGWTVLLEAVDGTIEPTVAGQAPTLDASLRSARASVAGLALIEAEVRARLGDRRLQVERLEGRFFGGRLEARGTVGVGPAPELHGVSLRLAGVDVLPSFRGVWGSDRFSGKGTLEVTCDGRLAPAARDLAGRGLLKLEAFSARVDLPSWNLFNVAPTLKALERVEGLSGGCSVELSGARALLHDLVLENRDLKVTGAGFVTLAGGLSIDCRSYLGGRLAKGLPGIVRSSFDRSPSGELIVPFRMTRTLADPKAEVDDVLKRTLLGPLKKLFD